MTYRADIDGLRALAVLLVVAFHAAPDVVPKGFIGLEEAMNTRKAEMEAGFERLSKELAQRDRALLLAIIGIIALAVAILKYT